MPFLRLPFWSSKTMADDLCSFTKVCEISFFFLTFFFLSLFFFIFFLFLVVNWKWVWFLVNLWLEDSWYKILSFFFLIIFLMKFLIHVLNSLTFCFLCYVFGFFFFFFPICCSWSKPRFPFWKYIQIDKKKKKKWKWSHIIV